MMDEPRPDAFVANATASSHNGGIRAGMSVDPAILARGNSLQSSAGLGSTEFESQDGHGLSPTAYRSESWGASDSTQIRYGEGVPNRQEYQPLGHPDLMSRPRDLVNQDGYGAKPGNPPGRVEDFYDGRREGAGERRGMIAGEHYPLHPLSTGDCPRSAADAVMADRSGGGEGGSEPNATKHEAPHYRQIERLVSPSSCGEGAPIESLGYNSRRPSGERIQTVESIRVIGRGGARPQPRGGESGARPNLGRGGGWYGDTDGAGAHPRNPGPFPHDDPHRQAFPFEERARLPYPGRDPQPQIPPSDFFNSPPPPIPPPPPPPIPQLPPPPKDFLAPPSSVMVGGVLVPVERPLSQPPSRGGEGEQRPGPVNTSAPVAPYKDHFPSRQAPSLSGSGPCRPPPSSLGRVREGPSPRPPPYPVPLPHSSTPAHSRTSTPLAAPHPSPLASAGLPPLTCARPTGPSSAPLNTSHAPTRLTSHAYTRPRGRLSVANSPDPAPLARPTSTKSRRTAESNDPGRNLAAPQEGGLVEIHSTHQKGHTFLHATDTSDIAP
ncbi:hypothetical protein GJAV_G00102080 [Gymnothorax javanicus]|nr:hypothetical protein GJAV_G00102080 [Gymnothorax javanicus]